jgi:hypothetical protein
MDPGVGYGDQTYVRDGAQLERNESAPDLSYPPGPLEGFVKVTASRLRMTQHAQTQSDH